METYCARQQARRRACGLVVLAALLVSSLAQDSSNDTVRVKVVFEGKHKKQRELTHVNHRACCAAMRGG
jgi:hypothetical protein